MYLALLLDCSVFSSTRVHTKMIHELALELVKQGHKPIVISPGESNQVERLVIKKISGITFWEFKNGDIRGTSKIKRAINESLLSFNAWSAIHKELKKVKLDGIINYAPSIFFGPLVGYLKSRYNCPSYLILRDLFPQWIVDAGLIKKNSLIAKYFRFFETLNYKHSDSIGFMSKANIDVFKELNGNKYNKTILYNWSETTPYSKSENHISLRSSLGLEGKVIFFYGGNIGFAQNMENLMRLARSMLIHEDAHFLFVGSGDEFELIMALKSKWNLKNVDIIPSVPQDEYKTILSEVDVGMFSLAKEHKCHNFPGKLLGYMLESKPILGSVNPGNDLLDFINDYKVGFAYINGEDKKLYESAIKLVNENTLVNKMGENSFDLLNKVFSVRSAAENIIESLNISRSKMR
jgi:glycosyltransferase involved in cell wall biosynthesis